MNRYDDEYADASPDHGEPGPDDVTDTRGASQIDRPDTASERDARPDPLATMSRIERSLDALRAAVDRFAREERHHDFSALRLFGAVAQALVLGLLCWALSDWIFGVDKSVLMTKLGFATVLQLIAMTAFVVSTKPTE
jgi:hypothetical protein